MALSVLLEAHQAPYLVFWYLVMDHLVDLYLGCKPYILSPCGLHAILLTHMHHLRLGVMLDGRSNFVTVLLAKSQLTLLLVTVC